MAKENPVWIKRTKPAYERKTNEHTYWKGTFYSPQVIHAILWFIWNEVVSPGGIVSYLAHMFNCIHGEKKQLFLEKSQFVSMRGLFQSWSCRMGRQKQVVLANHTWHYRQTEFYPGLQQAWSYTNTKCFWKMLTMKEPSFLKPGCVLL